MNKKYWDNIDKLEDWFISYLLYSEGKSLNSIARIRNESLKKIEKDLLLAKIHSQKSQESNDYLLEIMSLSKAERIKELQSINKEQKENLVSDIYTRYTKFKNVEDRMILIWLIGELRSDKLLPFLKMELRSPRSNQRRLACSALGKIKKEETKLWLEPLLLDKNPQVRQYAAKALEDIGDYDSLKFLRGARLMEDKDYVIRAIDETAKSIINRLEEGS